MNTGSRLPAAASTPQGGSPSFFQTFWVLTRLAWARTMTLPMVLVVAGLIALPMLFAWLFATMGTAPGGVEGDTTDFLLRRYGSLVTDLATPLLALLLGTGVWNGEREDGTLLFLVTTTTPRWWLVASRWLYAAVLVGALSVAAVWGAAVMVPEGQLAKELVGAFSIAVLFGSAVYAAAFTLMALATRRALIVGLLYILVWEGVLAAVFQALRYLSVRQWMVTIAAAWAGPDHFPLDAGPSVAFVLLAAVGVVVGSIVLGARRVAQT